MKEVGFWRVILPLCSYGERFHFMHLGRLEVHIVTRTGKVSFGGALLQDQHLFMVVSHSIYINTKSSFVFLYVMSLFHIFQYHVDLLNKVDR